MGGFTTPRDTLIGISVEFRSKSKIPLKIPYILFTTPRDNSVYSTISPERTNFGYLSNFAVFSSVVCSRKGPGRIIRVS